MLQFARGSGRLLSAVPRLHAFPPTPVPTPIFTAAISSSASSNSSPLLTTESLHAQYSGLATSEPRNQLAARNLKVSGKKPQLVERLASDDTFRARKLSTSSRQDRSQRLYKKPAVDEVPEIPKPIEIEIDEKPDRPIRVPIAPDNVYARYHRHEVVPEVAPPLKHEVNTALPDASDVIEPAADALADVLEEISVEAKAHKSKEQHTKEHSEMEDSVKGAMENVASGVREVTPKEGSLVYMIARLPVDLVKNMIEDVFSPKQQHAKPGVGQGSAKQQKE